MAIDYYRILGVIPGADEVVVRAAYRALAQRYHPDRFAGDPKEAHQRMAEINAAFAILGDPVKRAAYDAELRDEQAAEFASSQTEWQQEQAFSEAMGDLERRWRVACGVFPDLEDLKQELHVISSQLSFAFVTIVLESRGFQDRKQIAKGLERSFLGRYFGANPKVQLFAKGLITSKKKEAARALNELVSVMGVNVNPDLLLDRIAADFDLMDEEERRHICAMLREFSSLPEAARLAEMGGFVVNSTGGGLFRGYTFFVKNRRRPMEDEMEFSGEGAFIRWVRSTFCR